MRKSTKGVCGLGFGLVWYGMVWFDGLQIHVTGVFLESPVTHELPPYEVAEQRGTERQAGKQIERQGGKEARKEGGMG